MDSTNIPFAPGVGSGTLATARFEAALKSAMSTPHKPLKETRRRKDRKEKAQQVSRATSQKQFRLGGLKHRFFGGLS